MVTERTRPAAIAVCGAAEADEPLAALAAEVGRLIAEAGCTLVCGGMGGVMEAACRGAQQARRRGAVGIVLGVLPGGDPDESNVFCDVVVATGMGVARNALVVRSADAVILVGGGAGTLSEAAMAWQLGRPLIALASSGGWATQLAGAVLDDRRAEAILDARSPEEAVRLACASIGHEPAAARG